VLPKDFFICLNIPRRGSNGYFAAGTLEFLGGRRFQAPPRRKHA
jgi:hypothetical protein